MDALINTTDHALHERVIEGNGTRVLEISPRHGGAIDAFMPALQARIEGAKLEYGGALLRGFEAIGASGLDRFASRFGQTLHAYEFGSTPRSKVGKGVFSSTEYPADQWIDQHNEQSYTLRWPESIFFYCDIAAEENGATPVADSRVVYRRLDPVLRKHFHDKRIMYVRNFGNGLDVPWEQVFGTEDRDEVERYCRANQIAYEWLDDGDALRTRQVCQSEHVHPTTNERVWFNQAHLFHVSNLPGDVREALLDVVDEDRLPRNTYFGDGTPIDSAMLDEIRAVYRDSMLSFAWQAGDLLALDNVLMSHGRAPFKGKRRVLVSMTG
jgi:alpha-ketoglutarate-dependent taurine dioxygenase